MIPKPPHFRSCSSIPQLAAAGGACLLFNLPAAIAGDWDDMLAQYGELQLIAGLPGQSPDNGNEWNFAEGEDALQAELSEPHSALGDLDGNVIVADKNAHAIRQIRPDGTIHTIAGTNVGGFNGDGPAVDRQLNGPQNAYPTPDGSLYILDTGNHRIRRVGREGMMTTVITDPANLSRGLWVSHDATLIYYCTDNSLRRWTPSMGLGPGTVMATGFTECGNIDVARDGSIYVTDRGASQVFRITPTATPATYTPVVVAGVGDDTDNGPGSNGTSALKLGLRGVRGIAFHPLGGFFLATHKGGDIWYVDTAGKGRVIVNGNDGSVHDSTSQPLPTPGTVMSEPRFVSVAPNGDLLMATNDAGFIRRARYIGPVIPCAVARPFMAPGASLRLDWTGAVGRGYRVESSINPAGPWIPRAILRAGTAPAALSWTDENTPLPPNRFYRLRDFRAWPN